MEKWLIVPIFLSQGKSLFGYLSRIESNSLHSKYVLYLLHPNIMTPVRKENLKKWQACTRGGGVHAGKGRDQKTEVEMQCVLPWRLQHVIIRSKKLFSRIKIVPGTVLAIWFALKWLRKMLRMSLIVLLYRNAGWKFASKIRRERILCSYQLDPADDLSYLLVL